MRLNRTTIDLRNNADINPRWFQLWRGFVMAAWHLFSARAILIDKFGQARSGSIFGLRLYEKADQANRAIEATRPYRPRLSFRSLSAVMVLALIMAQVLNISAYEAHIINVTARIVNDIPDIDPEGGEFCDVDGADVTISSSIATATLIFTLDGSDPTCPDENNVYNGFIYSIPFHLTQSATVKALSCHDGRASVIATAVFILTPELCPNWCGDGIIQSPNYGGVFEQCDDGNNIDGDGCDAGCQLECVPEPEICDNIDNDCDGIVDNNVFEYGSASGSPKKAKLDDGSIVTNKVKFSDNKYAVEETASGTKYIYLNWLFGNIPANADITTTTLTLEHREDKAKITVEWWNSSAWVLACDPPESATDATTTCDLSGIISSTSTAQSVKLRVAVTGGKECGRSGYKSYGYNGCYEECRAKLDFAWLEIAYRVPFECFICGNGVLDPGEQCDDGNKQNNDGCDNECQTECVPSPEICDYIDNDCDGIADNNVFYGGSAAGSPRPAKLDDGTIVTYKTKYSDNNYAVQYTASGTKYIYLDWQFDDIPVNAEITSTTLKIEHRENNTKITVEWWDGGAWVLACDPPEAGVDTTFNCDLSGLIATVQSAQSVKLRVAVTGGKECGRGDWKSYGYDGHRDHGGCHEECRAKLDFAWLETLYRVPVECFVCGNGILDGQEQCDDGNTQSNDGCDHECRTEIERCLKINEVYYYPGARDKNCHPSEQDPQDEWIELYNACDHEVNLKDWRLRDNNGEETLNHNYPIAAGAFVVIAANASTWGFWPNIPNNAFKIALGHTSLFDGLDNPGDHVFLYDDADNLIDGVSWGTDISAFDPSVPAVTVSHSISRIIMGADTDTAADWMDTFGGSTPPGPNPGTNPHDADGNLILPDGLILSSENSEAGATGTNNQVADDNSENGDGDTSLQTGPEEESSKASTTADEETGTTTDTAADTATGTEALENGGEAAADSQVSEGEENISAPAIAETAEVDAASEALSGEPAEVSPIENANSDAADNNGETDLPGGTNEPAIVSEPSIATLPDNPPTADEAPAPPIITSGPMPATDPVADAPAEAAPAPVAVGS